MTRSSARTAAIAVVAALALLALGGAVLLYSGAYNVAATENHTAVGRWLLNTGQNRSVAVRADDVPDPPAVDSSMVETGFEHFRTMCVVCHGAPGVERGEFGKGMTPTPPELSEQAARFDARELFWIVKHGIKLAGMPAFGPTHSDQEIWGIVSFLERLEGMSAGEYQQWEARHARGSGQEGAEGDTAGDGHTHAPGTAPHEH